MIYIVSNSTKPQFNIAMEEYCFTRLLQFDKIFILWINEPSIIVGKHQNTIEEINLPYVRENGIHVVRRITGGGAVYHDLNNLNYTIISNEGKGVEFDFKTFSEPVIETLRELGVDAEFSGRNDIKIDGMKVCGNAQAFKNNRIMHHGCLLFDTDLTVLSKALELSIDPIQSSGVKSVRSAVSNIKSFIKENISVDDFQKRILSFMLRKFPDMNEYTFSTSELDEINQVAVDKFSSWDWNFGKSPKCTLTRNSRFPGGKIQVLISVENSEIKSIKFYGTFFGNNSDLASFEEKFSGVKYTKDAVSELLKNTDFSQFFAGFSLEELTQAIIE